MSTNQSELNQLRDLQDRFVNHPEVIKFAAEFGEDWPLFYPGGPSRRQLQEMIYPEYASRISALLYEWANA